MFIFLLLIIAPLVISTFNYVLGDRRGNWQTADRSSAGLLPTASEYPDALIRVYAARTVRWRGIFAVHTWIVVKERGASRYSRIDYTAWGETHRKYSREPIITGSLVPYICKTRSQVAFGEVFGTPPRTSEAMQQLRRRTSRAKSRRSSD